MESKNKKEVGREIKYSHLLHAILPISFTAVCILDSRIFKATVMLKEYVPFPFRITLFVIFLGLALSLMYISHRKLFQEHDHGPSDTLLTDGILSRVRNPMYLGTFLIYIGISIACVSWIYLLLAIVCVILDNSVFIIAEERWCLEHYGDAYREYMKRTPRWIGIPKSK